MWVRKSPINWLLTILTGAILWSLLGLVLGNYLSEVTVLYNMQSTEWKTYYFICTGLTTAITFILLAIWIRFGSNNNVLADLQLAKKRYLSLFIFSVIVPIVAMITLVILFFSEGISVLHYIIYAATLLFQSVIYFWGVTFFCSPTNVEYIPFGK